MRFLDELIVRTAHAVIRGIFAVGAGLVYVQVIGLAFVLALIGSLVFALAFVAIKSALLGA